MAGGGASPLVRSILIFGLTLALAGCLSLKEQMASVERQIATVLSDPALDPEADVPVTSLVGSASAVTGLDPAEKRLIHGIEARLRGADARRVLNDLAVSTPADLPDFGATLGGLKLREVLLIPEAAPAAEAGSRSLAGILRFGDRVGRSLDLGISSSFSEGARGLEVVDLTIGQVFDPEPATELFALPAAQIDNGLVKAAEDYDALYRAVESRAVDMTDRVGAPAGRQDYAFIAFLKTPLDSGAKLQMLIGQGRRLAAGDASGTSYRDFGGGWVVGLLRAEMDLKADPARWIALVHDPAGETRKARVIGYFSTRAGSPAQQSSQRPLAEMLEP